MDHEVAVPLLSFGVLLSVAALGGILRDRRKRTVRLLGVSERQHARASQTFRYYSDVGDSSNA